MTSAGKVKGVILEGNKEIQDDIIVITAGAWSSEILKSINISVPIYPERKEIYITEDIRFMIKPLVIDFGRKVYFSQTLKGEIIGGVEEERERKFEPFSTSLQNLLHFLKSLRELVKNVEGIGILRGWSGYYEMTPDHSHVMGYASEWPEGLYIDAGYSGHGMMFAPYSGKLMADLIADNKKHKFIDIFSPERFAKGKLINETMVI